MLHCTTHREGRLVVTQVKAIVLFCTLCVWYCRQNWRSWAKLCTWGRTFDESRRRMLGALGDFYIRGVETSIPLYRTILESKEYQDGELSTDFLARHGIIDRLAADIARDKESRREAAAAAAAIHAEVLRGAAAAAPRAAAAPGQDGALWKGGMAPR